MSSDFRKFRKNPLQKEEKRAGKIFLKILLIAIGALAILNKIADHIYDKEIEAEEKRSKLRQKTLDLIGADCL